MSTIVLPPELIEEIIDEVGRQNDRKTLKACSLVALAFVFPSQKHLFRKIDLDKHTPQKSSYLRFHKLLLSKPHLGVHIRELRLGDDHIEDDFDCGGFSTSWILYSTSTLPHTLTLLPRIEVFSLAFNSDMVNWKTIPAETRSAISRLFLLRTLKAVSLSFITFFPPQLLVSLTRLRYLALSCVEVDNAALIPHHSLALQIDRDRETNLQALFLRGTSPSTVTTLANALGHSPSHTLRKLMVAPAFEKGFTDAVSGMIQSSGTNVTTFEWLPSIHFHSSTRPIDLSSLPLLHTLRFSISFRKSHSHGPFHELLRFLNQLRSSQSTQLTILILDCHFLRKSDSITYAREWDTLDKMLSRTPFLDLREVRIRLCMSTIPLTERIYFVKEAIKNEGLKFMATMKQKGMLKLEQGFEDEKVMCFEV